MSLHRKDFIGIKNAWILSDHLISAEIDAHVHEDDLHVLTHEGEKLNPKKVRRENHKVFFEFSRALDFEKNHMITLHSEKVFALYSLEVLNKFFYSKESLGTHFHKDNISLSLWSPSATSVSFVLFDKDAKTILGKKELARKKRGVWKGHFSPHDFQVQSLDALFYQYEVTAYGKTHHALDPYAYSMSAFDPHGEDKVGKGALVKLEIPKKKKRTQLDLANDTDFIAYEAHIHDFTIDPNLEISEELKGTYKGFEKVIPHIKKLGVTHVQFMPLQNFATVVEKNRDFQGIDIPMEKINYNWGYDVHHYFSPEGWYSVMAKDPYHRVREVREMVEALHKEGIGAILDVVYNHLYHKDYLENAAPGCYLRRLENGKISEGTGAGVTLESRNLMTRRLIVDSLKLWYRFYGFDGFRFDLMGFLDRETMIAIRKALGPEAILYGEAWNFTDLPFDEATTKTSFPHHLKLGVFNDSARDSFTGQMSGKGFIQGHFHECARAKTGVIAGLKNYPASYGEMLDDDYSRFSDSPLESVNYLAIHDGFTLWDKINLSSGGTKEERENLVRMAFTLLLTSQGRVVLHGGDEIGRSKPLSPNDPNSNRAHSSDCAHEENGHKVFHENTYASPDATNKIDWRRAQDFENLKKYVEGLILLRRSLPGLRFHKTKSVEKGLRFLGHPENLMMETRGDLAGYQSFKNPHLKKLNLEFVGAPAHMRGKRFYLVGEVQPKNKDKNPKKNPYFVDIDEKGRGLITFTRSQILNFDPGLWSKKDNGEILFKLIQREGEWDFPEGLYSEKGGNVFHPQSILKGNTVVIDLGILDHHAGNIPRLPQKFIAYLIDNTLENAKPKKCKALPYKKILVVHNADNQEQKIPVPEIKTVSKWHVLADGIHSGVKAQKETLIKISNGEVIIPKKTSLIVGGLE